MTFNFQFVGRQALFVLCAMVYLAATNCAHAAEAARAKRVLIVHSFGREFAPFDAISSGFRTELARQSAAPIEFQDASLEIARLAGGVSETVYVAYLRTLFAERAPDLLVPIGGPAVTFLQRHRESLFRDVPILIAGVEQRILGGAALGDHATAVGISVSLPGVVEDILRILPGTTNIAVVIGNSPLESFWTGALRQDLRRFSDRLRFTWLNGLSFEEIRRRLAQLPRDSVIFCPIFAVDGAGVAFEQDRALAVLRDDGKAPIFGIFDSQLGRGIVGGSLYPVHELSREAARIAIRILDGEPPRSIQPKFLGPAKPVFDWRELQRWGIPETGLPPNSVVQFRPQSFWQKYQGYAIGALIIFCLQSAIIGGFLMQRHQRRRAEAELHDSQQFIELAASAGDLGLWSRDVATDHFWVNPPLRSMFGFSPDVAVQFDDMFDRIHPDDRYQLRAKIERAHLSGLPFEGEFRVVCPDGAERWLLAKGRDVIGAGDRHGRRIGVVLDITERKRSEQKFRDAVEASPNAILMSDAQGRLLLMNAQAEQLFGYPRQELLGQSVETLLPERFRDAHPAHREAFQAAPQPRPMAPGRALFGRCKDGREIPIEIGLSPIRSVEGIITLATIIDISERRRNAEALEKERKFLRQVIDVDPNFIFAKDRDGRFTLANKAVADTYGTTVENLIGKTDADFNPNRDETEFFRRVDLEVIDTLQERFVPEERITDAQGNLRWVQSVKRPIVLENGSGTQVLGASTDITRRKQTELALQEQRDELAHVARVSTMGELAASLAHELNQPLTAILSNAQAALRFMSGNKPADMEEVREILQDIVDDNNRAGEVIRRVRALVKKGELELVSLDLATLVRDVVSLVHSDAILHNIKIDLELDERLPPVRGDKVQLQQVVLNLILNAFDAMKDCPAAERQVTLRVEANEAGWIQTGVIDRGTGLSGDRLDKIFQPFFTTKGEGLGMGLSICRSIIEAHGGRLWAENDPHRGARFFFTLPLAQSGGGRAASRNE